MSKLAFTERAWEEYTYWQAQDKKTLKKINALLKDIERNGHEGIGKPEQLKYEDNMWSRRINDFDRLVYLLKDGIIEITQCKGHYDD